MVRKFNTLICSNTQICLCLLGEDLAVIHIELKGPDPLLQLGKSLSFPSIIVKFGFEISMKVSSGTQLRAVNVGHIILRCSFPVEILNACFGYYLLHPERRNLELSCQLLGALSNHQKRCSQKLCPPLGRSFSMTSGQNSHFCPHESFVPTLILHHR